MAGTTDPFDFPFPGPLDPTNPPGDIESLAQAVADFIASDVLRVESGVIADRPAAAADNANLVWFATDTGLFTYSTGVQWKPWPDLSTYLLAATAATTYLAKAGGTMAGALNMADQVLSRPELLDVGESTRTVNPAGAAQTIDYEVAAIQEFTLDQNLTITISNPPATGKFGSLLVYIVQPAVLKTVTWPASVLWAYGAPPTFTASKTTIIQLFTKSAGAAWRGVVVGEW